MIQIKRVYDQPEKSDGFRMLVDRLWPRGLSKEKAKIDLWLKEIAPSTELRKWFGHDPAKWPEFQIRYKKELNEKKTLMIQLKEAEQEHGTVTLVYGAKDEEHNDAVVLADVLRNEQF